MGLIGLGVLGILLGGAGAVLFRRRARVADALVRTLVSGGCGVVAVAAALALGGSGSARLVLHPTLPGGPWVLQMDRLSSWFLLILGLVGAATTWYGAGYLRRRAGSHSVAASHASLSVLLAAMIGVFVAQAAVAFLLAWEAMALSAYLVIVFEHDQAQVRRAGLLYLVLTHIGTAGLIVMFLMWGRHAPDLAFASLAAATPGLQGTGAIVLLLALLGFGGKAGIFPIHFWLPGAHASAPSHVSALLSGVMIKAGIYGLFRVLVLFGPPPAWLGWALLLLGLASAVLGVLWALAQHDIKRLLAYHSVENIGIILLGLGLGALGTTYHHPVVALLGFTGALLHTLNHALFKSLLFLGAGVVAHATGTREIDRLGGLARLMPRTALAFLIGSIAIVGLPPLNGFVSEWLVFQGLLHSGMATDPMRVACVAVGGLALTGALALACFAKLHGTVFLGSPRDETVRVRPGAESGLVWPQLALGAACVVIGLAPWLVVPVAARTAGLVMGGTVDYGEITRAGGAAASVSIAAAGLLLLGGLIWAVRRRAPRARRPALGPTWGCGYPAATSRAQHTASSFAGPLMHAFGPVSGSRETRGAASFRTDSRDLVLDTLARPAWTRIHSAASRLRRLQTGRIQWYLLYLILCLVGLLFYLLSARPR